MEKDPSSRQEQEESQESNRRGLGLNLEALGVVEIGRLCSALNWEASQRADESGCDDLLDMFQSGVTRLATEHPVRGRDVLLALKNDEDPRNREMAAHCSPSVLVLGYEFVRDILLDLARDQGLNQVAESAMMAVSDLEASLPPDQAADIQARYQAIAEQI